MDSIACILEAYDNGVIYEATHPRTGIQATEKFKSWPPNSGELKEFCDALSARNARHAAWFTLRLSPPVEAELPRPTDAELDAQFERLGLKHLRPGSKCAKPAHVVSAEVQMARAFLDRYADPKLRKALDEEIQAAAAASRKLTAE